MKSDIDDWGRDPSVRAMRRIFAHMETAQTRLLVALQLSTLDRRLRRARDSARALVEQTWSLASKRGITLDEDGAADLYVHALASALLREGIMVPDTLLPKKGPLTTLLREVLP
jgi:hypothetical protein